MKIAALIMGGGSSSRMGLGGSKLLLELCGRTVLERSVAPFERMEDVIQIVVTARHADLEEFRRVLHTVRKPLVLAEGGETRQQSVSRALERAASEAELILIHDGARPLVNGEVVRRTVEAARKYGAAAAGVPVKDTIKQVDDTGKIIATPARSSLYAVQTPQVFRAELYRRAMEEAAAAGLDFTDDCQLVERLGCRVQMVQGDYTNLKVTTRDDLAAAASILKMREKGDVL
ncbi:MAG: 2-C-methyl-D-erythritol 4-phosphate cytidylyltransferase [Clostridiales bacterium]|nr:2-C-methyl-D-erythritol 4-phosphate cytidylyltransferase [Clostridiales bacterium]